ncbi:molybdopterin-containing oxidoreductase family protein [Holophaga foetida]|uniref:molybdopterin-containing oxidoreductase family protein n=1 Tax=Holophaga foetida TaxID=35839 RepID=UPI0002474629|nr:molybdopterin oxidoreductase family protein [Holophaga foetida]
MSIIHAACPHDCPDTCALRVHVEGGRVVKVTGNVEHPLTCGLPCAKVGRYAERLYHPDRLLHPMKRIGPKGEGRFRRISWDEALDLAAERLNTVATRNPQAILPYHYGGTMGLVQGDSMSARLFHKLGASRLQKTICAEAGFQGLLHTYGAGMGMHAQHLAEARLILLWGTNPIVSGIHLWMKVQEAQKRGARVVVIDPVRTQTAEKADLHLPIRPGTDAALALAMIHVLIREQLLDQDYIARYTEGFEALKARAAAYPPEEAARICGLDVSQIENLALEYGHTKPAAIRLNYGMQRTRNGGQATRAICCLPSLVGAWRHRAGGLLLSSSGFFPANSAALTRPDLLKGNPRAINMSLLGEALVDQDDPIKLLFVYNSNPAAVAPDSRKVAQGLAREDLFTVVLEHFQTDTADYADLLLPATMQMEHLDIHKSYGHTCLAVNLPAVEAPGEALPNAEIFRRLARRLGFEEPCFRESDEEIARQAFHWERTGTDWETLKTTGWAALPLPEAPFAEGHFPTPSGRCQLFAGGLEAQGLDPLPSWTGEIHDLRYPLTLLSIPSRDFLNTTFANLAGCQPKAGVPTLEIHPMDAGLRGIQEGDEVRVFNAQGEIALKAVLTERVQPGVVVTPSIWWRKRSSDHKNANELTSMALTDLGGGPTFYDCRVEVVKPFPSGVHPFTMETSRRTS